jgi:translation initiation factor IF-2
MTDATGKVVKVAIPGMAVNVAGWKELPNSGDEVLEADESDIKKALSNRHKRAEHKSLMHDAVAINEQRQEDRERKVQAERDAERYAKTGYLPNSGAKKVAEGKELRLVIKGDVSGSVEAVTGALEGIGNHQAKVKVVSTGVGEVSESDVSLARAIEGRSQSSLNISVLNIF